MVRWIMCPTAPSHSIQDQADQGHYIRLHHASNGGWLIRLFTATTTCEVIAGIQPRSNLKRSSNWQIVINNLYLLLAVVGAVVPFVFFSEHLTTVGFGVVDFVRAGFANGVAGGFTCDVLISSVVFWVYLFSRKAPLIWMYISLNLLIGLSCALPLYLWPEAVLAESPALQTSATRLELFP